MAAARQYRRNERVDCTGAAPPQGFTREARLGAGGVHVNRFRLAPNEGAEIAASQLVVAIIESEPFDVEWRAPGEDRLHRDLLLPNSAQITPAGEPLFARWRAQVTILAVAFDFKLIDRLRDEIGAERAAIRMHLGLRDPEIDNLAAKLRLELHFAGASGPLYLKSLGVLLAVHVFRNYAGGRQARASVGGLGPRRLRRTIEYIEANLSEETTLAKLAEISKLSPHHFAGAFRTSTGVSPHRYIMERRIARSFDLLAEPDATVTDVAHALGFSSHGHFTVNFRRFAGVTPSQFKAGRR